MIWILVIGAGMGALLNAHGSIWIIGIGFALFGFGLDMYISAKVKNAVE